MLLLMEVVSSKVVEFVRYENIETQFPWLQSAEQTQTPGSTVIFVILYVDSANLFLL